MMDEIKVKQSYYNSEAQPQKERERKVWKKEDKTPVNEGKKSNLFLDDTVIQPMGNPFASNLPNDKIADYTMVRDEPNSAIAVRSKVSTPDSEKSPAKGDMVVPAFKVADKVVQP